MKKIIVTLCLCGCISIANAESCKADEPMFNENIANSLISQWNNSLLMYGTTYPDVKDAAKYVVKTNYAPHAVLLPTLSDVIRVDNTKIIDYFEHFLVKSPHLAAGSPYNTAVYSSCGLGVYNGDYDFVLKGQPVAHARYTFVYEYISHPGAAQKPGWYIVTHHSSLQPSKAPHGSAALHGAGGVGMGAAVDGFEF